MPRKLAINQKHPPRPTNKPYPLNNQQIPFPYVFLLLQSVRKFSKPRPRKSTTIKALEAPARSGINLFFLLVFQLVFLYHLDIYKGVLVHCLLEKKSDGKKVLPWNPRCLFLEHWDDRCFLGNFSGLFSAVPWLAEEYNKKLIRHLKLIKRPFLNLMKDLQKLHSVVLPRAVINLLNLKGCC